MVVIASWTAADATALQQSLRMSNQVLKAARGQATGFVEVVKASNGRYGATHAATARNELACGTKPRAKAPITGFLGVIAELRTLNGQAVLLLK
jgi:hypothetical protein